MSKTSTITEHIEITPGICGGKPRIAGHRIRVEDIVICHEKMGFSPDEIVSQYPSITLADVYAALTYYHDHLEEIRQQILEDEEFARAMQAETPSLVAKKLRESYGRKD
ncbi:DUF433 domain-containing protein [Okeania sp.]|uniref:DUF433 domain-containing protein n=1 Tax=Okeania sp. TaxID=3100323 RepID=UPI002B4AEF0B|nr:DUF433 domain-containing protein [Okeania sp.]MEB3343257.1 DUF433 domain-containing protein [Okeania sp.]